MSSQRLRAVLELRELILEGELEPGRRISEIPLSQRLGVSRTPLRLALAELEHEGLLVRAGGGFAVRSFTLDDVADAIDVRGALEGVAARMAAERLESSRELEALYGCVAQLDTVVRPGRAIVDFERYVELNERFHDLLVSLARSEVLRDAVDRAAATPFASPSAFVRVQAELPASHDILHEAQAQHHRILEAIETRDGPRADALAREHAMLARDNLHLAMESQAALKSVPGAALIRVPGRP
jgi:GntR family transcriptional regulator, vanillate catabolism transcriptional regulator